MEASPELPLPADIGERLAALGIHQTGEGELRRLLEAHTSAYTLYRLPPAAARKWKARYRIMLGATYIDCQSVIEAYARAYLFTRDAQVPTAPTPPHIP